MIPSILAGKYSRNKNGKKIQGLCFVCFVLEVMMDKVKRLNKESL